MITINKNKCISCLACISACPYNQIKADGLYITIKNTKNCKTCDKKCKILCPTGAITTT